MLFYQGIFLGTEKSREVATLCKAVAIFLHLFLLAGFSWMSVMAFDTASTFSVKGKWTTYIWSLFCIILPNFTCQATSIQTLTCQLFQSGTLIVLLQHEQSVVANTNMFFFCLTYIKGVFWEKCLDQKSYIGFLYVIQYPQSGDKYNYCHDKMWLYW